MPVPINFVVIDDELENVAVARKLLSQLPWPEVSVWPDTKARGKTTNDWENAWDKILRLKDRGWDPDTSCCVLLLDIALRRDAAAINEGVAAIKKHRHNVVFQDYVWIAWTKYDDSANAKLGDDMDAIIPKEHLAGGLEAARVVQHLEYGLQGALHKWALRTGRPNPVHGHGKQCRAIDSPAMRRFEAAFGRHAIQGMAAQIVPDWGPSVAEALSGGYSGAFLMRLAEDGADRQLVCKISRDEKIITDEVDRWKRLMAYQAYEGIVTPISNHERLQGAASVHLLREASVAGPTLEEALLKLDATRGKRRQPAPTALASLRKVVEVSVKACSKPVVDAAAMLRLSSDDIDRFGASLDSLRSIGEQCASLGFLNARMKRLLPSSEAFHRVLSHWSDALAEAGLDPCPQSAQHGDLNPRNILVSAKGGAKLIDYARFGSWPVAYDITRLELQLILRLLDRPYANESFPHGLKSWWRLWSALNSEKLGGMRETPGALTQSLKLIADGQQRIARVVHKQFKNAKQLRSALRCFDAIKICSYQDATPFKRLFFLLLAIDSAESAGLKMR